jgi:subtilisin family serine protease
VVSLNKVLVYLILCVLASSLLLPITTYASQGRFGVVEVVASSRDSFEKALSIAKVYGKVIYVFPEILGFAVYIPLKAIDMLKSLPGVVVGEAVVVETFSEELPSSCDLHGAVLTWNLDMINIPTVHEVYRLDGSGVYVAVLDTGLEPQWRDYFPEDRIASEFGAAFLGAMATAYQVTGKVLNRNAWEADTNGHGMHVTSTIIGFKVYNFYVVDGVAPGVRIIPVKVLSNAGWGFSTDVAAGIMYIANLYKAEKESRGDVLPPPGVVNPVIISMSLGGPELSPLEKAAIDYAISQGVFVVAAAGNYGEKGMAYPGAYEPVISVGAAGWVGEWSGAGWWRYSDVPENLSGQVYVTDYSSRAVDGQDLDVLAPGSWIAGPYTPYGAAHPPYWAKGVPGQYYFLGGTSMATPHVSGVLALLLQLDMSDGEIDLNQTLAEKILEESAYKITWFKAEVYDPVQGKIVTVTWGVNAVGNGLIQADKAVEYLVKNFPESVS